MYVCVKIYLVRFECMWLEKYKCCLLWHATSQFYCLLWFFNKSIIFTIHLYTHTFLNLFSSSIIAYTIHLCTCLLYCTINLFYLLTLMYIFLKVNNIERTFFLLQGILYVEKIIFLNTFCCTPLEFLIKF